MRLHPRYRELYDKNRKVFQGKRGSIAQADIEELRALTHWKIDVFLPYEEKDLTKAIKKGAPGYSGIEDFFDDEVFSSLEDIGKDNRSNALFSLPITDKGSFETAVVTINFSAKVSKKEVLGLVEKTFEKIEEYRRFHKIPTPKKPKPLHIRDALKIYAAHKYKSLNFPEIARRLKIPPREDPAAARRTVQRQYKMAVHYIEKGGFIDI